VPVAQSIRPHQVFAAGEDSVDKLTILIPVFNDWQVAELLVGRLDAMLAAEGMQGQVVFVDDGSLEPAPERFPSLPPQHIDTIRILELRRNLGHQRALSVGLVYLQQAGQRGPVVVMDADGEDSPSDIPLLLNEFIRQGRCKVIFAARARRTEGFVFRLFYQIYRTVHRALVGFDIRIGNFSVLPSCLLDRIVVASDLWNHYAAAALKMKLPHATVPINRAKRLSGQSKMGFVGLVVHGLSAMSVFGDVVGVRLLIVSGILSVITIALFAATLAIKFFTHLAIPGWATYASGLLLLLLSQCLMLSMVFTFVILYSRGQSTFVPLRDCPLYINVARTVFIKNA